MTRRRRRRFGSRKGFNLWIIVFQIAILIALLVAILSVRDSISSGTSVIVDSLTSEDIAVDRAGRSGDKDLGGDRTEPASSESPDAGSVEAIDADDGADTDSTDSGDLE